jgi:hypothetical protein
LLFAYKSFNINEYNVKNDKIAPFDDETFRTLRSKHGSSASFQSFPNPPENDHPALIVNESDILKSINSFPCGSAPGIDGMRPQFLKDMVCLIFSW